MRKPALSLVCVFAAAGLWAGAACRSAVPDAQASPARAQASPHAESLQVEVPPPPFSEGIFPCTECHNETDLPTNPTRRQLVDAHDDISLLHDETKRWCLDCHDAKNRDQLHLASGEPVPFERSYELCGQCHGEKYRDWRVGVHGRRVGQWNGKKEYLLCVHCHNPHNPRFQPIEPKPAPVRPSRTGR